MIANSVKRCGLVIRVSTEGQARNPEGSLKNQLQRLRGHIEYKTNVAGERWVEAAQYVLPAISGAKSLRSKQFAQLFEDIRAGKIDTILCTALDRICRSVKDFLNFFEILNEYDVEFVCLKQNYDTTSAQGRLFITIMMALAEFEREQTAERNRDASLARAERGLWNGGHLLGYDLPPDGKKGTLIPNEREAALVNFAFDTYLATGSIFETTKILNAKGYRTKEYASRRGKHHPAKKFFWTPVGWMLSNYAYIGKKEINKKRRSEDQAALPEPKRYRLTDATWPPIVSEEKFYAVQHLLEANNRHKTNQVRQVRHCYLFNHELLWCEACGTTMKGNSGTGRLKKRYYYYRCSECGNRVSATTIEKAVLERIRVLGQDPDILGRLVAEANRQLQTELPDLQRQRTTIEKQVAEVKAEADGLMKRLSKSRTGRAADLLTERLDTLGERRQELESTLTSVDLNIDQIRRDAVNEGQIREALSHVSEIFDGLPPYRKKELVRLVLLKAEVGKGVVRLTFRGRPPDRDVLDGKRNGSEDGSRSQTPDWLLG